jgi:hypothetical protein
VQANTKDISVGALAVYNSTHNRIIDGAICDAEANTNYNGPIVENRKISYRNGELIGHEFRSQSQGDTLVRIIFHQNEKALSEDNEEPANDIL